MSFRFGSKIFISISAIALLSGCFGPQAPAPVTMYGTKPGAGSAGIHRVSSGDTLYSISKRYNVVMRDIVVTNHLSAPFMLAPGQRLKLPPPQEYRVRGGDTLYKISRLFGTSQAEIAALNDMRAPYTVRSGQVLKLPSVTAKSEPAVIRAPSAQPALAERSASVPSVEVAALPSVPVMQAPPSQASAQGQSQTLAPPPAPEAKVQTASAAPKAKITAPTPKRASSKFLEPVNGRVISSYGPKEDGLHNDGINIAAPRGAPVQAAENGVVVYAGNELKGSGNLVLIRHADRWMTAYAHMDNITVSRGETVSRGQTIGAVGTTGSVDTPQLHFEVRRGTEAINPMRYIES